MKKQIFPALIVLLSVLASCGNKDSGIPNIVLIVADDLGWKDVGFMGSSYYETPNLDRLAGEGMVFRQAYASAANCAPSRACLMTGMHTKNTKILPEHFFTLAEALKEAGYTTANFGKWHLGEDPISQGMDYNVGGGIWGHPRSYFAPYIQPELEAPEGEYLTDRLTEEAIAFMRNHRRHPFFLYLPYYAVHTPLQAKPGLEQKYLAKGGEGCQQNPTYAAMVENMDSCIGSLVKELDKLGLSENTLVVFTSDNGGIREVSCQDPLRAGKGSYYEGGIRVPLLFRWPGTIQKEEVKEVPVTNMDFFPTFLKIAGMPPPEDLDGQSLWPLLSGEGSMEERPLFFHFPVYLQAYRKGYDGGRDPLFRTRPGSVIREGNWKLHYYYEDGAVELYKLSNDPGETNNLASLYTSKAEELLTKLEVWLEEEGAPVDFELNPEFDSLFEQQEAAVFYWEAAVFY